VPYHGLLVQRRHRHALLRRHIRLLLQLSLLISLSLCRNSQRHSLRQHRNQLRSLFTSHNHNLRLRYYRSRLHLFRRHVRRISATELFILSVNQQHPHPTWAA
jgi:hypothetical protein